MKKLVSAALFLSGLGLAAQDHAVALRYATLKPESFTQGSQRLTTDDYKGYGLRYGQTVARVWDARLDVEGTWQIRTSGADIFVNGVNANSPTQTLEMSHESMGLGASLTWTKVVDFGGALEVRHEDTTLKITSPAGDYGRLAYGVTRPWFSARVGYTFATAALRPFVALEYALPLSKNSGGDNLSFGYDVARKLMPKDELAFSAGLRF